MSLTYGKDFTGNHITAGLSCSPVERRTAMTIIAIVCLGLLAGVAVSDGVTA
jgi:hypothetical protein